MLLVAAAHNRFGSISGRAAPPGQPWVKAFNIFNALGSVAFAYNFTGVLMEIQVSATNLLFGFDTCHLSGGSGGVHLPTAVLL
jgi:hypothetical protein